MKSLLSAVQEGYFHRRDRARLDGWTRSRPKWFADFEVAARRTLEERMRYAFIHVQLRRGPFDLGLVFAPDGIETFDEADPRA
jgi:hypothetical protein